MAQEGIFTFGSFARCVRAGDSLRFGINLKSDFETVVTQVATSAQSNLISFDSHRTVMARGHQCVFHTKYETHLMLRNLARYLVNRFSVSPPNRNQIVAGVVEGLKDSTPFWVIKRDIRSFYESIPTPPLKETLLFDTGIPRSIRHYLSKFFAEHCPTDRGLPRGVGLTSALVEIAMQRFDIDARSIPGVYRYFRYADDILLFSYTNPLAVEKALVFALPTGMSFNTSKSLTCSFAEPKSSPFGNTEFEYLGYLFSADRRCGEKLHRKVELSISDRKLKRIKTRIILALKSNQRKPNSQLLVDRLSFLSGNYRVHKQGIAAIRSSRYARAGIFYNYQHCGLYDGGKFVSTPPHSLSQLDNFLHGLLWGKLSSYSAHLRASLSKAQREVLRSISFSKGFHSRRIVRFNYQRMAAIKEVWRNA